VKAAAVAAAVTVAGGVGYSAGTDRLPIMHGKEARASQAALAPAAHTSRAEAAPLRVAEPSRNPVTSAQRATKRGAAQSTAHKPAKTKPNAPAAKATRKATKAADRPQQPERAAHPVKAKSQHATPTRKRPVHEPKPKEERTPQQPERPVKPEAKIPVTPAPLIPPGLEKKLLEPPKPKPEKPTLPES
jgi:hypothetical protein